MSNPLNIAFLLKKHFPESAISAILGNIDVETGGTFDHTTEQRGGKGYGLFQFDDQQEAYWDWLESTTLRDSPESQIQFVADAIYNDEYTDEGMFTGPLDIGVKSRKKIRKAFDEGSTLDITQVFSKEYEKPSKPRMDKRVQAAEGFEMFKGLFTNPL
tara:strand:+ start:5717 stop:6190 length:474 start_codon:yes stop_codon:yes gene_type:complete